MKKPLLLFASALLSATTIDITASSISRPSDKTVEPASQIDNLSENKPQELRRYDYFFRWIPGIISELGDYPGFEQFLVDPEIINSEAFEMSGYVSPFADSDIKVESLNEDTAKVIVWTFPEPQKIPECSMVAFVVDKGTTKYFTIEKSLDDCWVLGTQSASAHSNYGAVERPADADAFVEILKIFNLIPSVTDPIVPAASPSATYMRQ